MAITWKDAVADLESIRNELTGSTDRLSPDVWRRRGAPLGLCGLDIPVALGGSGLKATEMARIFAHCGSVDISLRDVPGAGHARLLSSSAARGDVFRDVLRGVIARGDELAVALTEEQAGSDLHALLTLATPVAAGFSISGSKRYVARVDRAAWIAVFAKVASAGPRELTVFLVPNDPARVHRSPLRTLGLHGSPVFCVDFDEVIVPPENIVGEVGGGFEIFSEHFSYWRAAMAATAIGCAKQALRHAIEWLRQRAAFGGPIGRFTHLQQELSRNVARLHMAWLQVLETMGRVDAGRGAFLHAAMAKSEAVEASLQATDWAMTVFGALGYTHELDLERRVRDLMGLRIADGSTDVLRGQVARGLLGDDIYEASLHRSYSGAKSHDLVIDDFL